MATADAVIVGAGIMGCAIAHELAQRGMRDVVVFESDQIGRGATADAAGGIRQQFSTETNIRLATHSVRVWESFGERFDQDISLRQQGYLFLLKDPADEPIFRANLALAAAARRAGPLGRSGRHSRDQSPCRAR